MRQARAATIFLPSSSRGLDKWNSALPKLIKISKSITRMMYLNTIWRA
jgi:hypothetical protein